MKTDKLLLSICVFCSIVVLASCQLDAKELTPEEKYAVDTMFNNQLNNYRKQLDSICIADKDTLFARTVDSLRKEGLKEIDMLIMKNHITE